MLDQLGLGAIMGAPTGYSSAQGLSNGYNPAGQQASWGIANQAAQQQMMNSWNAQVARQAKPPERWMVDGRPMSFQEFVETVFPEDTPERTFFLLKYTK